MTGTLWHKWFQEVLDRTEIVYTEVNLDDHLPDGWSGTADWVFWHPEYNAWVLGDLKTIRGEGMFFITRSGAKHEHLWQLSAYWHALQESGIPLVKGYGVLYWPMNDTRDTVEIEPVLQEGIPFEKDEVYAHMAAVKASVDAYKAVYAETGNLLNDSLAPMPEREQKCYWNKATSAFEVKLMPHWMEQYCDYSPELCPRSGTTKIGQYTLDGKYHPRKGYENIRVEVSPTPAQWKKAKWQTR